MSTNHTPNYALSLWEASDQVQRTEFNENHAKIDAALAGLQAGQLRLHTGSYTGDGTNTRALTFPFYPKVLWVIRTFQAPEFLVIFGDKAVEHLNMDSYGAEKPWHATINQGFYFRRDGNTITIRGSNGLSASYDPMFAMNRNGSEYIYMALG